MNTLFFPINTPYEAAHRNDSPAFPVGPHSHDGAEVYLTLTELPDVLLGDRIYSAPAGTLIIIPPFCVHQLYHETGKIYDRFVLNVSKKWISEVFFYPSDSFLCGETINQPLIIPLKETEKKKLMNLFHKLLLCASPTSPETLVCLFELLDMLIKLENSSFPATAHAGISSSQQKVNDIIAFIDDHISENITISDLAGHFFLNGDYLARLFKKHAHVSIGHYITVQKINVSQRLLREGHSVENVSEMLNFSNYAHFFKTFQKITGMSPSRYRKHYLE